MDFSKKLILIGLVSCALSQGVNASGWANGDYSSREERRMAALSERLNQRAAAQKQAQEIAEARRIARDEARFEANEQESYYTRVAAVIVGACVCLLPFQSTAHIPGVENRTCS